MLATPSKFPFYAKVSLILIGLYVLISMLSIAQGIILPLLYATIIAILVSPAVNLLIRFRVNRTIAIAIVLVISIAILCTIIGLISSQADRLSNAWPQLTEKFNTLVKSFESWAALQFDISTDSISTWLIESKDDLMNESSLGIGHTITTVGGVLSTVFLTPVYIFMLLYYQSHLVEFIHRLFGARNDNKVTEILGETKAIIQSYLVGLFIEFVIVGILNSLGLLLLGIDYAIPLGVTSALLNIIPYLGGLISICLFMIIALITKSPVYVVYVVILYSIIQLIDNNYLVPKIVGSKVKLNAFVSIIVVIAGAELWGIPGMFLSIPLTAIAKLIFDRLEGLKEWGFLLGDK